jgi:hypothetical protein
MKLRVISAVVVGYMDNFQDIPLILNFENNAQCFLKDLDEFLNLNSNRVWIRERVVIKSSFP